MLTATAVITTDAGRAETGGGLPSSANVDPEGIAVAGSGHLLVADDAHNLVWLANLTAISTTMFGQTVAPGHTAIIAGSSAQGYSGDGGPATLATLNTPAGMVVDRAGNLYIADVGNSRIRRVDVRSGIISTFAGTGVAGFSGDGGLAVRAALQNPIALAVDRSGDLYVADAGNQRVRKINALTSRINTVAGTGHGGYSGDHGPSRHAQLNGPVGIAVDSAGDLFIADLGNDRIREVLARDQRIVTVAGTGTPGFSGDSGPAQHAMLNSPVAVAVSPNDNLIIADYANHVIRNVLLRNGAISTIVGSGTVGGSGDSGLATQATLDEPVGVAVDGAGNIYIADSGTNRVREVAASAGIIFGVMGTGQRSFSGDGGPAVRADLYDPIAMAIDSGGDLYVSDWGNNRVRRIDGHTGHIGTVVGGGNVGDGRTGGSRKGPQIALSQPSGLAIDHSGNLYIADTGNNRILKLDSHTGTVTVVAGTGTAGFSGDGGLALHAMLNSPSAVAVDVSNNLYIADTGNNRIREVGAHGGMITTVVGNGVATYSGDGGPATEAALHGPGAVVVDTAGNLYIADTGNDRVREVAASAGIIFSIAGIGMRGFAGDGRPAVRAALNGPSALALTPQGDLLIADAGNNRIRLICLHTGDIVTIAGSGARSFGGDGGSPVLARMSNPNGVAVTTDGTIYIADTANNRIRVVTGALPPATGQR